AYEDAFRKGLRAQGFTDGKEVTIDWRSAEGKVERADQIAAEFVRMKVNVIVASLTPGVTAATKATKTIPIVMAPVADPVATGFVKSLGHPGGNVTGITNVVIDVGGKLLGLSRASIACSQSPRASPRGRSRVPEVSSATAPTRSSITSAPLSTSPGSCAARIPATCRWSRPPPSSSSST